MSYSRSLSLPHPSDIFLAPQYLDRIGQLFFGVPPKQSPSYGGLLGEWIDASVEQMLRIIYFILVPKLFFCQPPLPPTAKWVMSYLF